MKSKRIKKGLIVLSATFAITFFSIPDTEYEAKFEIIAEDEKDNPFAKYRNGNIFIVSEEYINSIKDEINEGDILVIDYRNQEDPEFIVLDSYLIKDKEDINTLLEALIEYEGMYPSAWNRSLGSMRNELIVHNILYDLGVQRNRTGATDLNNKDEGTYKNKILEKILFN